MDLGICNKRNKDLFCDEKKQNKYDTIIERGTIMGFWIFMLCMCLLVPITMVCFGSYFLKKAPKNINVFFGYRTNMSMKNQNTWEFAHKTIGKIWRLVGYILLPLSVVPMLFLLNQDIDTTGWVGSITVMVQLAIMVLTIVPVEVKLHKTFDKNGNYKDEKVS